MKRYVTLVFVLSSFIIKAQDRLETDSIPAQSLAKFQLYVAPGYSLSQFVGTNASFAEIHLGAVYSRKIDVDVHYAVNLDNFQKQLIFPSFHYYDQKNFGIRTHYSFLKKTIKLHIGIGYQYIEATWSPEEENEETYIDHINMTEVFVGFSWFINKTFTLQGDGGYNLVNGVDLVGFESNDFGGLKALIMLKIGIFNF